MNKAILSKDNIEAGEQLATVAAVEAVYAYRISFAVGAEHHLEDQPEKVIESYVQDALADLAEAEEYLSRFPWLEQETEAKIITALAVFMVTTGVGE